MRRSVFVRRLAVAVLACAGFGLTLGASKSGAQEKGPTAEDLLKGKCTACHSGHRIMLMKPEEVRSVLQRMREMNPDLFAVSESDHVVDVLLKLLGDPQVIAERAAWQAAVERGEQLFNDPALGTTGKTCASCHTTGSLRNVEDGYPRFDPNLKRFVDIDEAINFMIRERLKGTPLPPNDQRYFDLLAYLKSLK